VFHHRVEDADEFANAGGHCQRMLFASRAPPQVEVAQRTAAQHRIVRGHVQRAAQVGAAAEDAAFTAPLAVLVGKRRDPDQRGYLARAERAQFRQARNQYRAGNFADPGHALKQGDPLGGLLLDLRSIACSRAAFSRLRPRTVRPMLLRITGLLAG
jgi:hypothetical protein